MGSVVHSITDTIGLTDYKGQDQARHIAKEQGDRSYAMSKEQLEFQRAQYDDWKDIYGPLQEDLGTYFKNLTGDSKAAQQIVEIQKASQVAQNRTDTALAQRGLSGSGLEAQALRDNIFSTEMQKANVRANADQQAAAQKMQFLGLGLGQGTQMLGINANVANAGSGNLAGMSNNALGIGANLSMQNQNTMNQYAGAAMGAMGANGAFGSGFAKMLGGV